MGNCQAVDAATLVIQHPTGKVEKLYWPITAAEVMKTNPGHYVALLLSTTLYPPPPSSSSASNATTKNTTTTSAAASAGGGGGPVRLTRIKLLRQSDTLTLGHVYRLITNQEVTKGLLAKKQAKLGKQYHEHESGSKPEERRKQSIISSDGPTVSETDESRRRRRSHPVTKNERNRSSSNNGGSSSSSSSLSAGGGAGSGSGRSRTWQPSLNSILESAGSSSGI